MSASAASTARPRHAAIAWATRDAIFCEIPCKDGPPFIIREKLTVPGLSRVLNVLIEHQEAAPPQPQAAHPKITKAPRVAWATDEQREKAREVLRRLKIT